MGENSIPIQTGMEIDKCCHGISVKLPDFIIRDPELWLIQARSQFILEKVSRAFSVSGASQKVWTSKYLHIPVKRARLGKLVHQQHLLLARITYYTGSDISVISVKSIKKKPFVATDHTRPAHCHLMRISSSSRKRQIDLNN